MNETVKHIFEQHTNVDIISAVLVNAVLFFLLACCFVPTLQHLHYRSRMYAGHLFLRDAGKFLQLYHVAIMSFGAYLIIALTVSALISLNFALTGLLAEIFFVGLYLRGEHKRPKRQKLVVTARVKRLYVTLGILSVIVSLLFSSPFYILLEKVENILLFQLRFAFLTLTPMLAPFAVLLANAINVPMERLIAKGYLKKTKKKLSERSDLKVIGITGSFGKTSVKNILANILAEKFLVLKTPENFNTPLGVCRTVLSNLEEGHEVFIVEMGARKKGDIREICDLVKPQFGLITSVGNQHLATFGTKQILADTKFELPLSLPQEGFCAFNGEDDGARALFNRFEGEKLLSGDGKYVCEAIEVSEKGSKFDLILDGERIPCNTVLLGRHNISNILLAAAFAHRFGLSGKEIARGIASLSPIPHRLQLVRADNISVIDDSYNANVSGAHAALKVLATFPGRKIIVTPGLIELGTEQNASNFAFGQEIAKTCDLAILVGEEQTKQIVEGLKEGGMDGENVFVTDSLSEATARLKKLVLDGDVILFENDLPDVFTR